MVDEYTEVLVQQAGLNPSTDNNLRGKINALREIIDYRIEGEE